MSNLALTRTLGLSTSLRRAQGLYQSLALDLDLTTGNDYDKLSITSNTAGGTTGPLALVYAGDSGTPGVSNLAAMPKPAGWLQGFQGARLIRNGVASWDLTTWSKGNAGTGSLPVVTLAPGAGINGGNAYRVQLAASSPSGANYSALSYFLTTFGLSFIGSLAVKSYDGTTYNVGLRLGNDSNAFSVGATWKRYTSTGTSVYFGLIVGFVPGTSASCDVLVDVGEQGPMAELGASGTLPGPAINPTASAGWITDPVTGERAYHLGSGVAISWTKPGGSVSSGVFTPALGAAIPDVKWRGPAPAETNALTDSSNATTWNTSTGVTYSAPWSQLRGAFSTYKAGILPGSGGGRYELGVIIKKVAASGVITIENPNNGSFGQWSVNVASLASGENWVTRNHPAVTIVSEFNSATFGGGVWFKVSSGSPEFDFRAMTVVTGTSAPAGPIETSGATASSLAETVAFPQAIGTDWTAVVGVDYSQGLPTGLARVIGAANNAKTPLYMNVNSISSYSVAYNESIATGVTTSTTKIGVRRRAGKPTGRVGGTIAAELTNVHDMSDVTGVLIGSDNSGTSTIGRPISTVKIWTRALDDTEFANA